jgi:hypothetical protein
MNQVNWIAAFLFIGFFVYVTIKGQLPQFQSAIFGGQQSGAATVASTASSAASTPSSTGTDPFTGLSELPPI